MNYENILNYIYNTYNITSTINNSTKQLLTICPKCKTNYLNYYENWFDNNYSINFKLECNSCNSIICEKVK